MPKKNPQKPSYTQKHPDDLATLDDLKALGLKPSSDEPVALFRYQRGDTSGVCGLFERAAAVPVVAQHDHSA